MTEDAFAPMDSRAAASGEPGAAEACVAAVLDSLAALDDLPVAEHVGVFEAAHDALRRALDGASDLTGATAGGLAAIPQRP